MIFEEKYRITIEDTGKENKVTNKGYLGILEDVACYHAASLGQGPIEVTSNGFAWILLNWHLKVIRRCSFGEKITIRTWPRLFDKLVSYRDFEVVDEKGKLVALGSSKWFVMNLETRRPLRLTEEYTGVYMPITEKASFESDLEKLNEPTEFISKIDYLITRRDIDSNGHMHNINYLDLAYEALPKDVYDSNDFSEVIIEYKKEIMYNDNVECFYSNVDGKHVVTIKTKDKVNAIVVLS